MTTYLTKTEEGKTHHFRATVNDDPVVEKMKLTILLLTVALISCATNGDFNYETAKYRRITSEADSTKNLLVKYVSTQDGIRGMEKSYWANGNLKYVAYSYDNKADGVLKNFHENGMLMTIGKFKRGLNVDTTWHYLNTGKLAGVIIHDQKGKYLKNIFYDSLGNQVRSTKIDSLYGVPLIHPPSKN